MAAYELFGKCHTDTQFRFMWKDATGKLCQHAVNRAKAKRKGWSKEDVKAQALAKMQRASGLTATKPTLSMSLADYGRHVLTANRISDQTGRQISEGTGVKDLECWNATVATSDMAKLPVQQITRFVLIEYLNTLRATEGWTANYKATISHKLRIVIRRGCELGAFTDDCYMRPKWLSTSSEKAVKDKLLLSATQVEAVRSYFDSLTNDVSRLLGRLRFEIAMITGARPGEWMALRVSDLEWLDNDPDFCAVWHLRHAMGTRMVDGKSVACLKDPKTKAGKRDLFLPAYLRPLLVQWIDMQTQIREVSTAEFDRDQQFLLTNQWGRMTLKQAMPVWWGEHRDAAGLPGFTLYHFRSSFSANCRFANGGTVSIALRKLMGHAGTGDLTSDVYATTDDMAAERLAQRAELVRFFARMNPAQPNPQPAAAHPVPFGPAVGPAAPVPANDDTHSVAV